MTTMRVPKREFIQHTSRYLKVANNQEIIITHYGEPCLRLTTISKKNRARDLSGKILILIKEDDINTPVLPELDI